MTLKWVFQEIGSRSGCKDWINLAQDREKWWALVNMVIKLRVPQNAWYFLAS
jgi:hypothetical protein